MKLPEYISLRHQQAFKTALVAVLSTAITLWFHLPNAFWAAITGCVLMSPSVGSAIDKGLLRLLGTVLGAALGVLLTVLFALHPVFFGLALFIVVAVSIFFSFATRYDYTFLLLALTALMVSLDTALNPAHAWFIAMSRVAEISVGVIVSWLVSIFVLPIEANAQLEAQVIRIVQDCIELFDLVVGSDDSIQNVDQRISILQVKIEEKLTATKESLRFARKEIRFSVFDERFFQGLIHRLELLNVKIRHIHLASSDQLLPTLPGVVSAKKSLREDLNQLAQWLITRRETAFDCEETGELLQSQAQASVSTQRYHWHLLQEIHSVLVSIAHLDWVSGPSEKGPRFHRVAAWRIWFQDIGLRSNLIKHSLKTSLGCLLTAGLWLMSGWKAGLVGVVSALLVSQQTGYDSLQKGQQRLLGSVLGGGLGLLFLLTHNLHTSIFYMALFIGLYGFSYLAAGDKRVAYLGVQAGIAFCLALIASDGPNTDFLPPLERLAGVGIGTVIGMIVNLLLWPVNYRRLLRIGMKQNFSRCSRLLRCAWPLQGAEVATPTAIHYLRQELWAQHDQNRALFSAVRTTPQQDQSLRELLGLQKRLGFVLVDFIYHGKNEYSRVHDLRVSEDLQKQLNTAVSLLAQFWVQLGQAVQQKKRSTLNSQWQATKKLIPLLTVSQLAGMELDSDSSVAAHFTVQLILLTDRVLLALTRLLELQYTDKVQENKENAHRRDVA